MTTTTIITVVVAVVVVGMSEPEGGETGGGDVEEEVEEQRHEGRRRVIGQRGEEGERRHAGDHVQRIPRHEPKAEEKLAPLVGQRRRNLVQCQHVVETWWGSMRA